jgi:hypothetical protein
MSIHSGKAGHAASGVAFGKFACQLQEKVQIDTS